jgi:ATP-binding cassette subfamily B protein
MPTPSFSSSIQRLLGFARVHRPRFWLATACSVLNKIFDLAPPLLIGMAVDVVVKREDSLLAGWGIPDTRDQFLMLALLTFLIWAAESVFEYAYGVLWRNLAQSVEHDLRMAAYTHVQGLELAFFEDASTGGLMSVLNDDVNQLERFLDSGVNDLLQVSTTVLVIGSIFFFIEPSVAWMAMAPMPFILWGSLLYQRRLAPRYTSVRESVGVLNTDLAGNLGGIATIKSFTAEGREVTRIREASDGYRLANKAAIRLSSAFSPLIRMVIVVGFLAMMVHGGFLALDGKLEVGEYSVLVFLTQRLLWPLTRLGATFDLFQRAMASIARIFNLLDSPPGMVSGHTHISAAETRGEMRVEDVDFSYGDGIKLYSGLSLEFAAGKETAIVGATGSGKSTLLKLLMRFYDVSGGHVSLDGHDLRELDMGDLRRCISLVSQDVFLFHGTVRENIAYGDPTASSESIEAAAKTAEADEFIRALPQGYDTVVGERGQKLSGGQRQRISLARAVLKDAPIFVLDEATSSVDNETEAAIQRSLARIIKGRTTIVVAHRLSTVRNSARIYVLDHGQVQESGTHEELLERDGMYADLWRVQTGEAVH